MLRVLHDHRNFVIAVWVVAGAFLLGWHQPVAAQSAVPVAALGDASALDGPTGPAITMVLAGDDEAAALAQVPRADVEPGPTGGGGSYALGALVGAVVAVVAALRERFTKR